MGGPQHVEAVLVEGDRSSMAMLLCLCQMWLGWMHGAASCCSSQECTLLSLQMFLLTGTDKPSPYPPNGSIFPYSNTQFPGSLCQGGNREISWVDVLFNN